MAKRKPIPTEVQAEANQAVHRFDKAHKTLHNLEFKGGYAYLKRVEEDQTFTKIGRLTYLEQTDEWDFTVFKYSTERYDPSEFNYPGRFHLDGTIEGVLWAGLDIYPPANVQLGVNWKGCLVLLFIAPLSFLIWGVRSLFAAVGRLFRRLFGR